MQPLVLVRTLYVCSCSPVLEENGMENGMETRLAVFPTSCRTGDRYAYFRSLLREAEGGVESFFANKVYEGVFTVCGTISPIGSLFSRMLIGTLPARNKLLDVKMYKESEKYMMVCGYERGRTLFPIGHRYDLL